MDEAVPVPLPAIVKGFRWRKEVRLPVTGLVILQLGEELG
jgi:hypothetical protein